MEQHFPLRTLGDVRKFFEAQLSGGSDVNGPDLVMCSIVSGYLEHFWTLSKNIPAPSAFSATATAGSDNPGGSGSSGDYANPCLIPIDPALDWSTVQALQGK